MSVNKPANLKPSNDDGDNTKRGSLFERASGAFGLDRLKPAAVPDKLADDKAKKFAPRRRDTRVSPTSTPAPAAPATLPEGASVSTGPALAPAADSEPAQPKIVFRGGKQSIDRKHLREQGLIDPDGGASTLLEEFRIVKRQVLATMRREGSQAARRVLVCSPHPNEGKTFCALNLAIALAGEREMEVLLIDADFGKPSIMGKLGLDETKGFMDVLADERARVEDFVLGTDVPGLYLLPAGERTGRDSEYLASQRTQQVLDKLTRGARNRIVIFDSPPALAATPAAELAKHAGQALLVARADMTGRAALEDAIDLLSACPDIRLLLNDATFSPSGRRFGTYYGYGE